MCACTRACVRACMRVRVRVFVAVEMSVPAALLRAVNGVYVCSGPPAPRAGGTARLLLGLGGGGVTRVPRLATDDDGSGPARRGPLLQAWTRPSLGCLLPVPLSAGPASLSCVNVGECALRPPRHRPPREINKANVWARSPPAIARSARPSSRAAGTPVGAAGSTPHATPDAVVRPPARAPPPRQRHPSRRPPLSPSARCRSLAQKLRGASDQSRWSASPQALVHCSRAAFCAEAAGCI